MIKVPGSAYDKSGSCFFKKWQKSSLHCTRSKARWICLIQLSKYKRNQKQTEFALDTFSAARWRSYFNVI